MRLTQLFRRIGGFVLLCTLACVCWGLVGGRYDFVAVDSNRRRLSDCGRSPKVGWEKAYNTKRQAAFGHLLSSRIDTTLRVQLV